MNLVIKCTRANRQVAACVLAIAVLSFGHALAKKPDNADGGGGAGDTGPSYEIVELDSANGQFDCYPNKINNFGLAVGIVEDVATGEQFAACWSIEKTAGYVSSTLQLLAGGEKALGVNDLGEIAGQRVNGLDPGIVDALYWEHPGATPLVLPALGGDISCGAKAINDKGVICGWSQGPNAEGRLVAQAVVWRVNYEVIDGALTPIVWGPLALPKPLGPEDSTWANAINDNDADGIAQVVGQVANVDSSAALSWHVMSLPDGSLTAWPVVDVLGLDARATGVNNAGQVCGYDLQDAIVWDGDSSQTLDKSATINVLGKKSFGSAIPYGFSDDGMVVGQGWAGVVYRRAVVWPSVNATMVVLDAFIKKNGPFTELNAAHDVNGSGEIIGYGWDDDRKIHPPFLALPK